MSDLQSLEWNTKMKQMDEDKPPLSLTLLWLISHACRVFVEKSRPCSHANPAVHVAVCLTPHSAAAFASLMLVPRLQMSHWSRCRSHRRPPLPLSPRQGVEGDVAAKRGADGVMKGPRGCLALISALILATAGSASVSGISHQQWLQKEAEIPNRLLLALMMIGLSIKM